MTTYGGGDGSAGTDSGEIEKGVATTLSSSLSSRAVRRRCFLLRAHLRRWRCFFFLLAFVPTQKKHLCAIRISTMPTGDHKLGVCSVLGWGGTEWNRSTPSARSCVRLEKGMEGGGSPKANIPRRCGTHSSGQIGRTEWNALPPPANPSLSLSLTLILTN